jgi:beta-phosphoglucomutase-like phosphatase (HAD superfamily)
VIFDCDGVLVDSELIFARLLAERLTAVDFPTTIDEAITLGFGKNRTSLLRSQLSSEERCPTRSSTHSRPVRLPHSSMSCCRWQE